MRLSLGDAGRRSLEPSSCRRTLFADVLHDESNHTPSRKKGPPLDFTFRFYFHGGGNLITSIEASMGVKSTSINVECIIHIV